MTKLDYWLYDVTWRGMICCVLTLRRHWWKHYPGTKRYVHCRICGKLPAKMWETLQKIGGWTVVHTYETGFNSLKKIEEK